MDDVPRAHRTLGSGPRWASYKKGEDAAGRLLGSPKFDSPEPLLEPHDLGLVTRVKALLPRWSEDPARAPSAATVVERSEHAVFDRNRRDQRRRRASSGAW